MRAEAREPVVVVQESPVRLTKTGLRELQKGYRQAVVGDGISLTELKKKVKKQLIGAKTERG